MNNPPHVRDCLCLHTRRTARLLTQFYDDALRPSGLRITQFLLLAAIREAQPITHKPLAGILGMDRTTLTRNLALLERDGLAIVTTGVDDKRENSTRLTRAGLRAVERAQPHWEQAQRSLLDRLGRAPQATSGRQALTLLDRMALLAAPGEASAGPAP
jgi:DNA-binding MarR family transcriptional regulator